jgi:putative hydrolases of HD superfamily
MSLERDMQLLFEIGNFRYIRRTWERFGNPDMQSNTEHAFRVAWIALTLAKMEGAGDHAKLLKMALVHDLPESRCGDVDYVSRLYTTRDEARGVEDIFKDTTLGQELVDIWKEYEKRECVEAKMVKDADVLDVEFELREQKLRGHGIGDLWAELRKKNVYPKLYTQSAKTIWDQIHESNPFDWHLKGQNRHTSGDWKPT